MKLLVDKFFCFGLESTAKFIGWLGGICSILIIIFFSVSLGNLQREDPEYDSIFNLIILGIVACCINVVMNICLVVGTIRKRHNFLLPTLVFGVIGNVYSAISLFNPASVGAFVVTLSVIVFHIYLLIAIYSLYKKIKEANCASHK